MAQNPIPQLLLARTAVDTWHGDETVMHRLPSGNEVWVVLKPQSRPDEKRLWWLRGLDITDVSKETLAFISANRIYLRDDQLVFYNFTT